MVNPAIEHLLLSTSRVLIANLPLQLKRAFQGPTLFQPEPNPPVESKSKAAPSVPSSDEAAITDQWIESYLEQAQDSLGAHLGLCEHGETSLLHDLQLSQLSRL